MPLGISLHGRRRARELGLGPLHSVNLAEAREQARQARQMLLDGVDPIEERKAPRGSSEARSTPHHDICPGRRAVHGDRRGAEARQRSAPQAMAHDDRGGLQDDRHPAARADRQRHHAQDPVADLAASARNRLTPSRSARARVCLGARPQALRRHESRGARRAARCPASQAKAEASCGDALWRAAGIHGRTAQARQRVSPGARTHHPDGDPDLRRPSAPDGPRSTSTAASGPSPASA